MGGSAGRIVTGLATGGLSELTRKDPYGLGGSGGKDASKDIPTSPYENNLAAIAAELYKQTNPVRQNLLGDFGKLTEGNYNPRTSPIFAPTFAEGKRNIEDQYGIAKENILANTPRGGALTKALTDLEASRAGQASELPSMISKDIITDMLSKSYGAAFGAPQQSMSALGTAASTYGQKQAQSMASQSQQQAAKYQGMGQLAGMAAKGAMCWVAEVLYGKTARRTKLARRWCAEHDNIFTRAYAKYGRTWAGILTRHTWLQPIVKPIWDYMWKSQSRKEA